MTGILKDLKADREEIENEKIYYSDKAHLIIKLRKPTGARVKISIYANQ